MIGCWSGRELPVALRAAITAQWPDEAERGRLYCDEPGGHDGPHRACVVDLDAAPAARARALWAQWSSDAALRMVVLVVLDDCASLSPSRMDACARYRHHDGPHTWERWEERGVGAR